MTKLSELLKIATHRRLTTDERKEIMELLWEQDPNQSADIMAALMATSVEVSGMNAELADSMIGNILDAQTSKPVGEKGALPQTPTADLPPATSPIVQVHRLPVLKTAWFRYAAAIALMLSVVAIYYNFSHSLQRKTAVVENVPSDSGHDVQTGFNRAVLTLSDGRKVELDSAGSQTIKDGTLSIENNNGQLIYKKQGGAAINTMTTPKGGQYQLTLADGTRVWLNAESNITYPTAFLSKMRVIQIRGEAYFEVAENKSMPFIVKVGTAEVKVLGTHFNVMAYDNEQSIEATLLEGSIKFVNRSKEKILNPGQQLRLSSSGEQTLIEDVDVNKTIAWKNGMFHFENADIKTIMRQIERWYDVEVVIQDEPINDRFYLEMPRSSPLADVLKVLRLTGKIKFDTEGKKIIVRR